ncbi:MAG: acyl-CoA dehydrogenase family protein [Thermoleophilia bacterium]
MPNDFDLSPAQKAVKELARGYTQDNQAPHVAAADAEPDPLLSVQATIPAYIEAYKQGIAFGFLPTEYGGGGLTTLDIVIAAEEICAVDPGFACTLLVNGLGLLPVLYWGSEEQKERFFRPATADVTGRFIVGYGASEPPGPASGTANFDTPLPKPAGIGLTAESDGDGYVLNGTKFWPCNVGGWDGLGADFSLYVIRTDPNASGKEGTSAIIVERGTPGITYEIINTQAHRLTGNWKITFDNARVPAENLIEGTFGNGDLLINRNFAWSGPVAGIAAVGVARTAYETALAWAKENSAGGPGPIIRYQNAGYILGDVGAKIEACRYFCWKAAHYIDSHDYHGELIGAMCKTYCTETMLEAVYKCMQVVGVNSMNKDLVFDKLLREASLLPIYDGGNMGMQRRRVHGIIADPTFNPRAMMDNEFIEFTKDMEGMDTIPGPTEVLAPAA